jgi:hypothetical protein
MNADFRHSEPRIAAWLAEGPDSATADSRRAIAAEIGRMPQHTAKGLSEITRHSRLLAAAAVLIVVAAFGIAAAGFRPVAPEPTPTTTPEATASAAPRVTVELDHAERPMVVTFEPPDGFDAVSAKTDVGSGLAVFSSSALGEPADGYPILEPGTHGISIADVTTASEHGSVVFHPVFGGSAIEFLAGLDANEAFMVEDRAPTSLGRLPAWSARVSLEGQGWTHIDVQRPTGGKVASISFDNASIIFVADLADAIVLVQVWADSPENLESWLPRAMVVVNSIEFEYEPRT